MPARPPAEPTLGRRSAVLVLAAGAVLAGCDHGDDIGEPHADRSSTPSGSPSTSASSRPAPSSPGQTPDQALVAEVVGRLNEAVGVLVSARTRPDLRQLLTPLLRAHRQHLEALDGQVDPPSGAPRATLQQARRSEKQLQSALVEAAGKAESGALAKLLASMSASVTQHLDAMPKAA